MGRHDLKVATAPSPDARIQTITQADIETLLDRASAGMKLFILLCLDAGLRSGTARQITRENWKPESGVLTFETKGDRHMTVPATARLATLLNAAAGLAAPGQSLIAALSPISEKNFASNRRWNRLRKRCPVNQQLRPHDLRRTAATRLYQQTKDLRAVQQFLGHRSLLSTVRYIAPLDPGNLKALVEACKVPLSTWRKP
jgi:integrase